MSGLTGLNIIPLMESGPGFVAEPGVLLLMKTDPANPLDSLHFNPAILEFCDRVGSLSEAVKLAEFSLGRMSP